MVIFSAHFMSKSCIKCFTSRVNYRAWTEMKDNKLYLSSAVRNIKIDKISTAHFAIQVNIYKFLQ